MDERIEALRVNIETQGLTIAQLVEAAWQDGDNSRASARVAKGAQ